MERSLARRRRARARAAATRANGSAGELPSYSTLCWRALSKHGLTVVTAAAAILSLVLLSATRPGVSDATSGQPAARVSRAGSPPRLHRHVAARPKRACEPGSHAAGYFNPLAAASVTPKRIDQGVDYVGTGALSAIGDGVVTYVATSETGWPGAFIEYRLRSGPEAGCYVFYAEGVVPAQGLHVGQRVHGGQAIATIDPGNSAGIEVGWGAGQGTQTYAAKVGQWSAQAEADNIPTGFGLSFSALIQSLGGPPGKVEIKKG